MPARFSDFSVDGDDCPCPAHLDNPRCDGVFSHHFSDCIWGADWYSSFASTVIGPRMPSGSLVLIVTRADSLGAIVCLRDSFAISHGRMVVFPVLSTATAPTRSLRGEIALLVQFTNSVRPFAAVIDNLKIDPHPPQLGHAGWQVVSGSDVLTTTSTAHSLPAMAFACVISSIRAALFRRASAIFACAFPPPRRSAFALPPTKKWGEFLVQPPSTPAGP